MRAYAKLGISGGPEMPFLKHLDRFLAGRTLIREFGSVARRASITDNGPHAVESECGGSPSGTWRPRRAQGPAGRGRGSLAGACPGVPRGPAEHLCVARQLEPPENLGSRLEPLPE